MSRLKLFLAGATRNAVRSWAFIALLAVLCAILAVLQYRWIGEVTIGERERLKAGLDSSLRSLAREFNSDLNSSIGALLPPGSGEETAAELYSSKYADWLDGARHPNLFRRLAFVTMEGDLHLLDPARKEYLPAAWPENWLPLREWLKARPFQFGRGGPGGGGFGGFGGVPSGDGTVVAIPRLMGPLFPGGPFGRQPEPGASRPAMQPPVQRDWFLAEVDVDYVREHWMPALVEHHLGRGQYEAEISSRIEPERLTLAVNGSSRIGKNADAAIGLFEISPEVLLGIGGRGRSRRGNGGGGPPRGFFNQGPPPGMEGPEGAGGPPLRGRWMLSVRNKAGSLETIIQRARWRNLGISLAVLGLMVATSAALIRYSRRAERLAQLQMDFVAGISHELRTPLTVIRMAGFNLKGKIAQNPAQVEKYGALIAQESERLTAIVEQVLRFAAIDSGKAKVQSEPVDTNDLITHTLESCRSVIEHARVEVEQQVAPALPVVLGDSMALQHALQNLITNAVKYGTEGSNWIGLTAATVEDTGRQLVEIRVTDRGPGIPEEEQAHLFDPFFRGRRAMQDQIHGTGLGLNLVKNIVEAHSGTVTVQSAPGKGTEFAIRIPVAPAEYQDEFAHSFG